jgi:hypothetical protein
VTSAGRLDPASVIRPMDAAGPVLLGRGGRAARDGIV